MALYWVYTCPSAGQGEAVVSTGFLTSARVPSCSAGGAWIQLSDSTAVVAELNHEDLAEAWGAGFVVMGIGLLLAWSMRAVIGLVKSW